MTTEAAPRNVFEHEDTQAGARADTGRRVWSRPRVRVLPVAVSAQFKIPFQTESTDFNQQFGPFSP